MRIGSWVSAISPAIVAIGQARRTVAVPGASHAIAVSQPDTVAQVILQAAELRTAV
jgi:pimeloyl-ACP methyl ester carboxylesterase